MRNKRASNGERRKGHKSHKSRFISLKGKIDHVSTRFAVVQTQDGEVRIPTHNLRGAIHGDEVSLTVYPGKDHHGQAKVTGIVSRGRTAWVGTLRSIDSVLWFVPDNRRARFRVRVGEKDRRGASQGDKVIVKVFDDSSGTSMRGGVETVLGGEGIHEVEMNAIMEEYGLARRFSKEIDILVKGILAKPAGRDFGNRKDFRDVLTFTIDPEDAKDFDDAISVRKTSGDLYEIGIHIADVSHFVKEGSELDLEAFKRGSSVYLIDRTLPMLPEGLSNDLCSLKSLTDRLTVSVVFEMDVSGKISNRWIGRTIIHCNHRFSYQEAQESLRHGGLYGEELGILNKIAQAMRSERISHGSINFDTPEMEVKLDEKGVPLSIRLKEHYESHMLVEEFMLLANKEVARCVFEMRKSNPPPLVYRIHEPPDGKKIEELAQTVRSFGFEFNVSGDISKNINRLLDQIRGTPGEGILQVAGIRTMSKARYSQDNRGHFGLAFERYAHFTSPIRRYADLMVHRLLLGYLEGKMDLNPGSLEGRCDHISSREQTAQEAERASVRQKQLEYISMHREEACEGIVSNITAFGIFVMLDRVHLVGMIPIDDLTDDVYVFERHRCRVVGRRRKKSIGLADRLRVGIKKINMGDKTLDLSLKT